MRGLSLRIAQGEALGLVGESGSGKSVTALAVMRLLDASARIEGSIRSGLRYVRYAPDLRASLVRAFTFPFFISAIWSLLAVVAKRDLKQGPLGYGILNGSMGLGAVMAATVLYRVRQRFSAVRKEKLNGSA